MKTVKELLKDYLNAEANFAKNKDAPISHETRQLKNLILMGQMQKYPNEMAAAVKSIKQDEYVKEREDKSVRILKHYEGMTDLKDKNKFVNRYSEEIRMAHEVLESRKSPEQRETEGRESLQKIHRDIAVKKLAGELKLKLESERNDLIRNGKAVSAVRTDDQIMALARKEIADKAQKNKDLRAVENANIKKIFGDFR